MQVNPFNAGRRSPSHQFGRNVLVPFVPALQLLLHLCIVFHAITRLASIFRASAFACINSAVIASAVWRSSVLSLLVRMLRSARSWGISR